MMTKQSVGSSDDGAHTGGHDIQVITDISVQIEGGDSGSLGWKTPTGKSKWADKELPKPQSSTETLVKNGATQDV